MCKINAFMFLCICGVLGALIVDCEDKIAPSKQNQFKSQLVISYHCEIPTNLSEKTTYSDKMGYVVVLDSQETYRLHHAMGWNHALERYIKNNPDLLLTVPQRGAFEGAAYDIGFKEAELTIMKLELVYNQETIRKAVETTLQK